MPESSLDGCWAKIGRAHEHVEMLKDEISRYGHATVTVTELDENSSTLFIRVSPKSRSRFQRWSLIAAEVIYNLRASLDYLVYEAVALNQNGVYWDRTQFPIIGEARVKEIHKLLDTQKRGTPIPLFTDRGSIGTLQRLSDKHRTIVEEAQPVRWPYGYLRDHPLALLSQFSNKDKHRLPLVTFVGVDPDAVRTDFLRWVNCQPITNFSVIVRPDPSELDTQLIQLGVVVTGPQPHVNVKRDLTGQVRIEQAMMIDRTLMEQTAPLAEPARFVIQGMTDILDRIAATVVHLVREFEPAF